MSRFIAVVHGWHVESKGFDVHQLEATELEQAEKEAAWLKDKRDKVFDRCAWLVIEIADHETLPRRLSWRERLTGRVAP